jgi:hypothetical protein
VALLLLALLLPALLQPYASCCWIGYQYNQSCQQAWLQQLDC